MRNDVLYAVLWIIELLPTHVVFISSIALETQVALLIVIALDATQCDRKNNCES